MPSPRDDSRGEAAEMDLIFKALASEPRRRILRFLGERNAASGACCASDDDVCACELTDVLGLTASTISHHMAILRDAGLVTARKKGLWVHYALRRDVLDRAAEAIRDL